jgi:hypothetical protein
MNFYNSYKELLKEGKPLPQGVIVSIGSKGSVFFSDSISEDELKDRRVG